MAVPIEDGPSFTYGKPRVLFQGNYVFTYRNFDIFPDGQRFLMVKDVGKPLEPSMRDEITVVLNWTEELKRLVPGRSTNGLQ